MELQGLQAEINEGCTASAEKRPFCKCSSLEDLEQISAACSRIYNEVFATSDAWRCHDSKFSLTALTS